MAAYAGPVPPTPTNDVQWTNWLTFQIMLQNLRYEDERAAAAAALAARQTVLDAQHDERMAREAACAAATQALAASNESMAAAQQAHAAALSLPQRWAVQTDEQMVQAMLPELLGAGVEPDRAVVLARQAVRVFRFLNKVP